MVMTINRKPSGRSAEEDFTLKAVRKTKGLYIDEATETKVRILARKHQRSWCGEAGWLLKQITDEVYEREGI
jgi:hypothetical protein